MPPKRKRPERASTDGGRPAPHRPGDSHFNQHDRTNGGDDGYTKQGGRGGRPPRRNDRRDSHQGTQGTQGRNQPPSAAANVATASPAQTRPPSSSSQAPPPPPAPIARQQRPPSPSPVPPPVTPIPSNYSYDTVTDERIARWAATGRQEVVDHGIQSRNDVDITELSCIFQEFIRSVLDGRLPSIDAGACIKEIIGPESSELTKNTFALEPHALFLDTLATVLEGDLTDEHPQLRFFLDATGISHQTMREMLEVSLLNQLGLIRDSFAKLGIRHATNLLYRQANYNLLREETEGYSKLITELFTTSGSGPPTADLVQATFEKVKALIGTFDLDVGRVLDVTLDVFAAVLIKQFRFFIKFLRVSSWWPRTQRISPTVFEGGLPAWALPDSSQWQTSEQDEVAIEELKQQRDSLFWERARDLHLGAFFELGGRQITDAERETLEGLDDDEVSSDMELIWMSKTKTLPPQGNKTAAQLLGFKLRFYASEARDEEDVLPANLLYLAALLIKVGFISLTDLYPHLWPLDQDMDAVRDKKLKELEEKERASRPGGGMNALLMAGALPDDTVPTSTPLSRARETAAKQDGDSQAAANAGAEEKSKLPEPMEQKVALVLCLLTIGALPEALFMLGRFPWMADASPEVLDRIHRILNHSLHQVYKDSQPTRSSAYVECPAKDMANADQIGAPKGTVKLGKLVPRKTLRWPFPDKADTNDNQHYRFYWDEWTDNIPVCRTVDDVFTLCSSLLNVSGVNIGKDETLLPKLATIGAKSLAEDSSKENRARWLDLLKRLLVPALSMTKANSATVNAVWSLLSTYPTHVRYNLYAEWYEGQISRLPAIKAAFARTRLETLNIMKRLSLTNLSDMAKSLAKTSYSSPGVVFKVALDQIESYANLIDAFVECAKYFTDLSYDVLVWSLMNSLGGKNRSRTQETSVLLTSKWLQALSRFAGRVFRRYSVMNPTPVIQYVDDQLFKGNSTDLIILKELISSMGGVVPSADFTDAQILAMSGGETLRRQTLISVQDKRFDSVKSSKRLIQALIDSRLAGRLLVNLVQYRQAAIYKTPEDEAHIKYLSSMIDDSNQILTQYLDLLRSNLEPSVFDSLVPAIDRLLGDFGVDVSLAFLVSRPSLSFRMMPKEEQAKAQLSQAATDDGDVSMADVAASQVQASMDSGDLDDKMEVDKREASQGSPPTTQGGVGSGRINDPFLEVLQPVMDTLERIKEPTFWKAITPEFYTMFWALQLGDLYVPEEWYQKEEDRAYTQGKEIMRDRSDMTRNGITKKEEKHKALLDVVMKLGKEKASHRKTFARNKFYITRRFKTWFPAADQAKPRLVSDAILEQCLLPRLVLSAGDAEYCHRVIRFLHDFACPNFSLMSLYERLFNANRLRAIIFTCTVREVEHFGRFLKCVLSDLSRWHKDKAVYEKDALLGPQAGQKERNLPGFATTFDGEGKPTAFLEHAQFRDTLYGWHRNLNTALKSCLGGMEWMHIRNAITVLKCVLDFFPAVDFMAQQFIRQLKAITERESAKPGVDHAEAGNRVDLSVAAQTALSELQKRKSKWVMVQGFRPNTSGDISQDIAQNSNLRPTANEFKPGRAGKTSTSKGHAAAEDEDGEVKDGEDSKTKPGASNTSKDTLPPRPDAKPGLQSQGPGSNKPSPRPASAQLARQSPAPSANASSTGGRNDKPAALPERPPHGLPIRPDVRLPGYFPSDRFGQVRGEHRETRETWTTPTRETRDARPARDTRESREPRDARDKDQREARDATRTPDPSRLERPRDLPNADRRTSDHPTPRDNRDARDSRDNREARETKEARETPRHSDAERAGRNDSARRTEPHDRESRQQQQQQPRDRPSASLNGRGHNSPRPRDSAPATPTPASSNRTDAPSLGMNPERAALLNNADRTRPDGRGGKDNDTNTRHQEPDRADMINPARAALIDGGGAAGGGGGGGGGQGRRTDRPPPRDDGRDRGPRAHSPRRRDRPQDQAPPQDGGRDDRHGRGPPASVPQPPSSDPRSGPPRDSRDGRDNRDSRDNRDNRDSRDSRPDPAQSAGGRGDKRNDRESNRHPDNRPLPGGHGAPPRSSDADHGGRPGPYQDQNYGRLNPIPSVADIPSGPRGRVRGATRSASGAPPNNPPGGRSDARFPNNNSITGTNGNETAPPRGQSPDRHPPTGPSSSRGRRGQFEANSQGMNPPGPSTPAPPSHSDRGRQGPPGPSPASSFGGTPSTQVGVHPDRLSQIAPPPPPPNNANASHGGYSRPPMHQGQDRGTPSGGGGSRHPSGNFTGPNTPDTSNNNTPMGPSGPDRLRSGGRRQLAGINNMLQQAQANMSDSSRSRRSSQRTNLAGSDAQVLTGASPVSTPTKDGEQAIRLEAGADRGSANGDGHSGRPDDRGRRDRDRSERSGRSRRSSRERDRDRDRERDAHRDRDRDRDRERDRERDRSADRERDKESRNYRERRSAPSGTQPPLGGGRDERESSRRSGREPTGREPMGPSGSARDPPPSSGPGGRDHAGGGGGGAGGRVGGGSGPRDSRHQGGEGPPPGRAEEWNNAGGGRGGGGHRESLGGGGGRDLGSRTRDDRREPRDNRGRKRRSEEGAASMSNEREKRQRR